MNVERKFGQGAELIWKDRKRFMGMPLSFTRYKLINKPGSWCKVFLNVGLLYSVIEEVNLYRVYDVSMKQTLSGKIFNTGTITLFSNDERSPEFVLRNVKNPFKVREMFSNFVEEQRKLHNVRLAEFQA